MPSQRTALARIVAAVVALAALGGIIAAGAGAAGNRATPEKPKRGAEYFEGSPTVAVRFRWKLPKGDAAGHIEISRKRKQNPDGSFVSVSRSKGLKPHAEEARIGIPQASRYYWHVSSSVPGRLEEYGPTSSFVVLNTLSSDEAIRLTRRMIKDRITTGFHLQRLGCRKRSKLAARCEWSATAGGFTFHARGTTFLKRSTPDNFRFYHYDFHVDFTSDACVADHQGRTSKCADSVHWRA